MIRAALILIAAGLTGVAVREQAAIEGALVDVFVPQQQACSPCVARPPRVATPIEVTLGEGDLLAGLPGEGPLTIEELRVWLDLPENHAPLVPRLPLGLDAGAADLVASDAGTLTRAKIELGRQLFFDPRLSADGTVSCASCHDPDHGYAAPTPVGVGVGGRRGTRNAPTVANRQLSGAQFWDGRAASLEEQSLGPIAHPREMGSSHEACVATLSAIDGYRSQFERVFAEGVTIENVGRAIGAFERALVTGPSPWDYRRRLVDFERAYADDLADPDELAEEDPDLLVEHAALREAVAAHPMSAAAERGAELFFGDRGGCAQCHVGANLTDERFYNLGVGLEEVEGPDDEHADWGRFAITERDADRGAFKTPSLRNVAETAPYMHDGSQRTLSEVVEWYVAGGHDNPWLSEKIGPLDLDADDQADLVAFLEALSGPWPDVQRGRLPR